MILFILLFTGQTTLVAHINNLFSLTLLLHRRNHPGQRLTTTYKKELPHLPDMQGQADIVTEDISLLERLVAPVGKVLRENF